MQGAFPLLSLSFEQRNLEGFSINTRCSVRCCYRHLVESGTFLATVELIRGERSSPHSMGWDCAAKSSAFRGRKVPTLVSPGRGESPTYSHVTLEKLITKNERKQRKEKKK